MCRYGVAYIPKPRKSDATIPSAPEGIVVSYAGPFQINFSKLHQDDNGIIISLHDGHCLCDYKDWNTLFDYLESIRSLNNLERVEFLLYWSDDVYPLTNRVEIDRGLDTNQEQPSEGVIYEITVSVPRRLKANIGKQVYLLYKSGKELRGHISSYEEETGNGILHTNTGEETVYFHDKEISLVKNIQNSL